jgi:uncharacterized protein (DUF486 family)
MDTDSSQIGNSPPASPYHSKKIPTWIISVLVIGAIYCLDGIVFGMFAGLSKSPAMVFMWRLAAWVTCSVLFAGNIWYEYYRFKNAPFKTALHVSLASALGAFGLAVAANIHAQFVQSANQVLLTLSLIIWPFLTIVPAFIVAFAITSVLQYFYKKASPK